MTFTATANPVPVLAWAASPVQLGRIPGWLKKRLTLHRRRLGAFNHADTLLRLARAGGGGWLDHWGTTIVCGEERFVSEPYPMTGDAMRAVLRFADALSVAVSAHAMSYHNPTACVRLVFAPGGTCPADRSALEEGGRL